MEWAEMYFKQTNGYVKQSPLGYKKYIQLNISKEEEEVWIQELIQKHLKALFQDENTTWIHLSILVDLLFQSTIDKKKNCRRLIFELKQLRFVPVWNMLLTLKPMVDGDHCLYTLVGEHEVLKDELEYIIDKYIPYPIENEHENFVERYQHLVKEYLRHQEECK